ncbi:MAG: hypothetical protein WAN51_05610, partial [Alphaproteobacteria bacterium]
QRNATRKTLGPNSWLLFDYGATQDQTAAKSLIYFDRFLHRFALTDVGSARFVRIRNCTIDRRHRNLRRGAIWAVHEYLRNAI